MEVPFEFLYCRPCVLPPLNPNGSQGLYTFSPSCHSSDPYSRPHSDRYRSTTDPPLPPTHSLSSSQTAVCTATQRPSVAPDSIVKIPLRSCAATFVFERPLLLQIGAYSGGSSSAHSRPVSTASRSISRQNSSANLCTRRTSSLASSSSAVSGALSTLCTPFCPRAYVFVEKLSSSETATSSKQSRQSHGTSSNHSEQGRTPHSSSLPEKGSGSSCSEEGHCDARPIPEKSTSEDPNGSTTDRLAEGQWMQTGSNSIEILRFLRDNLDILGSKSAAAQGVRQPMTSLVKLEALQSRPGPRIVRTGLRGAGGEVAADGDGNVRLYVRVQKGLVRGFLKVGKKILWIGTKTGMEQISAFSLLDFYVFESCQREGHGGALFRRMLQTENVSPCHIAYDRPSPKLLQFLTKNYGLRNHVPQANNFVLFDEYFLTPPAATGRLPGCRGSSLRRGEEQPDRARGARMRELVGKPQASGLTPEKQVGPVSQNWMGSSRGHSEAGGEGGILRNRSQGATGPAGEREENAARMVASVPGTWPCCPYSNESLCGSYHSGTDTRGGRELLRKKEMTEHQGGVGEFSPVLSSSVTDALWAGRSASFHRQLPTMVQAASGSCSGVQTPGPSSSGSSRQTSACLHTPASRNASSRLSSTRNHKSQSDLAQRQQITHAPDSKHIDCPKREGKEDLRTRNDRGSRLSPSAGEPGGFEEKAELRSDSAACSKSTGEATALYAARRDSYLPDSGSTRLRDRHLMASSQDYPLHGVSWGGRRSEGGEIDYLLDSAPPESYLEGRDQAGVFNRASRHSNSCSSTTSTTIGEDVRQRGGVPPPSSPSEAFSYDRSAGLRREGTKEERPPLFASLDSGQKSPAASRVSVEPEKSWKRHPLEAGWRDYEHFAHPRRDKGHSPWDTNGGLAGYADRKLDKSSYERTPVHSTADTEGTVLVSKHASRPGHGTNDEGERESRTRADLPCNLGSGRLGSHNRGPMRGVYEQLHQSQVATLLQWQ